MALFKIQKGPSSRINQDTTEFHDGYAYFTPDDGGFYIDSEDNGEQKRIRINPKIETTEQVTEGNTALVTSGAVYDALTGINVDIDADQEVIANSENPVSGKAVAAYAQPLAVLTTTDPGAGVSVSYANRTVIHVYE